MASILLGTAAVKAKLQRVEKFLRSRKGLEIAAEHILNRVGVGFRRGMDPASKKPWKRLRPNTIAGRRKGTSKPLNNTGLLRASFTRGGRNNIYRFRGSAALVIGSSRQEAVFHNFGTRGPYKIRPNRKKSLRFVVAGKTGAKRRGGGFWAFAKEITHPGLPARPMLKVSRGMAIRVAKLTAKALDERLEG